MMVFETSNKPYPNLSTWEFLHFYGVRTTSKGNVITFHKKNKGQALVQLEKRYSNAMTWTKKFFFLDGTGWEFLEVEGVVGEFLVKAIWAPILDDKSLMARMGPLSRREYIYIEIVRSWATACLEKL